MPDPATILTAALAAAVVAAVVASLAWPWRHCHPWHFSAAGAAGVGASLILGAYLLGVSPHWPPREDLDRLLMLVVPGIVAVEFATTSTRRFRWLTWTLRLAFAASVVPLLLHGSVYLAAPTTVAGSNGRWGVWGLVAGLGLSLMVNLWSQDRLAKHISAAITLTILGIAVAGSGVAIMLSGYATGGQLAFPLTAGLISMAIVSLAFRPNADVSGPLGVGITGLFSLLLVGNFFGNLTSINAALLFAAPLLGWVGQLAPIRCRRPSLRWAATVLIAAGPVAIAVGLAANKFVADVKRPAATPGGHESSLNDYMQFSK